MKGWLYSRQWNETRPSSFGSEWLGKIGFSTPVPKGVFCGGCRTRKAGVEYPNLLLIEVKQLSPETLKDLEFS